MTSVLTVFCWRFFDLWSSTFISEVFHKVLLRPKQASPSQNSIKNSFALKQSLIGKLSYTVMDACQVSTSSIAKPFSDFSLLQRSKSSISSYHHSEPFPRRQLPYLHSHNSPPTWRYSAKHQKRKSSTPLGYTPKLINLHVINFQLLREMSCIHHNKKGRRLSPRRACDCTWLASVDRGAGWSGKTINFSAFTFLVIG